MSDHEDWFEFNLEHSPYAGGGYDAWLTSEPEVYSSPDYSGYEDRNQFTRCACGERRGSHHDSHCGACGRAWTDRRRDPCTCPGDAARPCLICGRTQAERTRCDCNGRGRGKDGVCFNCGRKAER